MQGKRESGRCTYRECQGVPLVVWIPREILTEGFSRGRLNGQTNRLIPRVSSFLSSYCLDFLQITSGSLGHKKQLLQVSLAEYSMQSLFGQSSSSYTYICIIGFASLLPAKVPHR